MISRFARPVLRFGVLIALVLFISLPGASSPPESPKIQEALARLLVGDPSAPETIRVVVEALRGDHIRALKQHITEVGGRVELSIGRKIQAQLPLQAVESLAARAEVEFIRLPFTPLVRQGSIVSEGLEITEADRWHAAGLKGQGVKVAILDAGFLGYERLLGRELPPKEKVIVRSFRADGDIECRECDRDAQVHGLAVAEIVHDMAPGATLYLVNFNTDIEMEAAVKWLISEGVDVINTSFSFLTTSCPYEGTGFLDPIFEEARENGIFWAASAGNEGRQHWAGTFTDPDGDGLNNFFQDDESQTLRNLEQGDSVVAILWWDDPCRRAPNDYDLVLEDEEGEELERSFRAGPRGGWPLEVLAAEIPRKGNYELKLERTRGEKANRLSLVLLAQRPQYIVPEGSAGLTEPEMSRFVISVGATDLRNRLEEFSSQGPAPDGRIKPEIVAPNGVSVSRRTFGQFFGTSASSPHVAGAGALVKSAFPGFGPVEVWEFLKERAEDLGTPGPDGRYGYGLLTLGPVPAQPQQPPIAPSDLLATAVVPTQVELSWRDNSEDEEGFIIERRLEAEQEFAEIARVGADLTRYLDTTVQAGTAYCYRVRAFNAAGISDPSNEACVTTPAENRPPIADAGPDQTVFVGDLVQLDGSRSSDPDGDPLSFRWTMLERPEGSTAEIQEPTSPIATLVPDLPGVYLIELKVEDGRGGVATDTVTITAEERPVGELVAVKFIRIEFLPPEAWERRLGEGCVIYRNISEAPASVRLALVDGSVVEYEIPPGNEVIVCGDVAHIDARARPKAAMSLSEH